jgi:hypothetical protein
MMNGCRGFLAVMLVSVLTGCGGGGIDENTPIETVAAEAAEMGKAELQKVVDQYQPLLEEKVAELGAIKDQLGELSVSELLGEKAKSLKNEMGEITTSMNKLKEQLAVYTKALSSAAE